ncbi:hypothetical protein F9817_16725 [Vibrio sp. CAIM 722]|uniref:Uncharacterized protein n=1 Tax=Vibrio eleionomae TaxID=2653505 RepID=A0A7X4RVR0_9VIBR|nr:hypothetical protein [Vibrio eleionomae]MZI94823.1 hypothetical protein [Vibrio eleionomae]
MVARTGYLSKQSGAALLLVVILLLMALLALTATAYQTQLFHLKQAKNYGQLMNSRWQALGMVNCAKEGLKQQGRHFNLDVCQSYGLEGALHWQDSQLESLVGHYRVEQQIHWHNDIAYQIQGGFYEY